MIETLIGVVTVFVLVCFFPQFVRGLLTMAAIGKKIFQTAYDYLRVRSLARRDRGIEPKVGQMWNQNGTYLTVKFLSDNGRVGVNVGSGASWLDSREEWEERKRSQHLHLVRRG